jgi:hypothetical protein
MASMRILAIPSAVEAAIERRRAAQQSEPPKPVRADIHDPGRTAYRPRHLSPPVPVATFEGRSSYRGGLPSYPSTYGSLTSRRCWRTARDHFGSSGHVDLTMLVKRYRHSTSTTVTGHIQAMDGVLGSPPSGNESSYDSPRLNRRTARRHRVPSKDPRGRSSAGRALDWQSRGSWVRVPSPPLEIAGQRTMSHLDEPRDGRNCNQSATRRIR